jgi:hypothetical protein
VNLVAEYDEAAFANLSSSKTQPGDFDPETFVDELKRQTSAMRSKKSATDAGSDLQDDDISALRGDINRLQQYLQEENREQTD